MEDRKTYIDKLAAQLKEWDSKIEELEARGQKVTAEARKEFSEEIEGLRKKKAETQEKLKNLREAGDSAWQDIKQGAEKSWKEMQNAFERAKSKLG